MSNLEETRKHLPSWRSHKVVRAARIVGVGSAIDIDGEGAHVRLDVESVEGLQYRVLVKPAVVARYTPVSGDYYVIYDNVDGGHYESVSPRAEFEAGYARL